MHVLMTGGTGSLGNALRARLVESGHSITCLSRRRTGSEGATEFVPDGSLREIVRCDAIINLAGESVVGLWSRSKRRRIYESRIGTTRRLAEWIEAAKDKPKVFLSGSAVGIYGDAGHRELTENADVSHANGFLARVCRDWEHAANPAAWRGTRTVLLRTGPVLDPKGGYLAKALPLMRRFPIVILGPRNSYFPWIALGDWVSLVIHAIEHPEINGALNLVGPNPVTQEEFVRAIAGKFGKPVWGSIPRWLLRLGAGEFGTTITFSQRALPAKALASGFSFSYPSLETFLTTI